MINNYKYKWKKKLMKIKKIVFEFKMHSSIILHKFIIHLKLLIMFCIFNFILMSTFICKLPSLQMLNSNMSNYLNNELNFIHF